MNITDWARFERVIGKYYSQVGKQKITWHRMINRVDRYGEDYKEFQDIELEVLVGYNAFRIWPIDKMKDIGIKDNEYCYIYILKDYLEEKGLVTDFKNFNFNPGYDRFTVNGILYKPAGDTDLSQAFNHPIFIMVILHRAETGTHDDYRP